MYGKEFEAELEGYESRYPPEQRRAALLEALHAVQARHGHVPEEAVTWLAARYGLSAADVQGVLTFYVMYFTKPRGKHVAWICRTFSCELMGARAVAEAFERELGCHVGETDPKGEFHLRWMECLAACDKAPCALIDDDMYECLTPQAVRRVLEHVRAGGGGGTVKTGADGQPRVETLPMTCKAMEARA